MKFVPYNIFGELELPTPKSIFKNFFGYKEEEK